MRARRLVAEIRAARGVADVPGVEAQCLSALAGVAVLEGDPAAALELQRRAVATARTCGFRLWEGWGAARVAQLAFASDPLGEATESALAALVFARRVDDLRVTITALALLAAIAHRRHDPDLAGRLWGAIDADESQLRVVDADPDIVATVAELRADDDSSFVAAVAEGRHLTLDRAAALALQLEAAESGP